MARILLTQAERDDLNDLAAVVMNARGNVPCGEWGNRTLTAWLTWWNLALASAQESDAGLDLPDYLVGTEYRTLYSWTDRIFRQDLCYTPSVLEQQSFEEMWRWLREVTGTVAGFDWSKLGWAVGAIGLAATAWSLWRGKRK